MISIRLQAPRRTRAGALWSPRRAACPSCARGRSAGSGRGSTSRFTPDEFIVSVAGSEETYRSTPHLAIERRTQIVKAIGPEAPRHASEDVVVENGFRHSGGSILSDVGLADIAFRYTFEVFTERVRKGLIPFLRWMKPDLLIHPLHVGRGQITKLEMRALFAMGRQCRVRNADVYLGPELSDLELRTGWYVTAD